jgi:hypothetical protein
MGKRFLRSIVTDFQTLTASADITPIDLPVNPLTHIILTLNLTLSPAQAATASMRTVTPFLQMISDLSIRHRGENIIQGSLQNVAFLNWLLTGYQPWGREFHGTNNVVRSMSFLLSFSRVPYWHEEAFPATMRGNLRFFMTAGALPTGYTAAQWAVESVELIEDNPTRFLKYTTLTRAVVASGRQRISLPIGNDLLGLLLFDPSDETDATMQYLFGKVKILKDNVEQYFSSSNWEALAAELGRRGLSPLSTWGHRHEQLAADTSTGDPVFLTADLPPIQFGYLDFDPLKDGSFSLETAGAAALDLDMDADTNTGTVNVVPVELVVVPGAAPAA